MKRFSSQIILIAVCAIVFTNCTSQRYVSSETDDIYYSSTDRSTEEAQPHNQVSTVNGEDYKENSPNTSGGYYSLGKESQGDNQNPSAEAAYSEAQSEDYVEQPQSANTINNFYGNTTYQDGDYVDDSYASRIRRFNNTNVAIGYYDPFFIDPYWSYGWGWNNPWAWNRPYNGWSIGYNSWNGWNAGYNWGWGAVGYGGRGYCGWNDPFLYNSWYGPVGCAPGWGWNGGWGNNYAWGYQNGFNDGYYYGNLNRPTSQSRPIMRSKAPVAGNSGFSDQVVTNRAPRGSSDQQVKSSSRDRIQSGSVRDRVESNESGQMASTERLDRSNNVYQTNVRRVNSTDRVNANATKAGERYSATSRANAADKYNVRSVRDRSVDDGRSSTTGDGRVVNTQSERSKAQYNARNVSDYSGSSRATYGSTQAREVRNNATDRSQNSTNARSRYTTKSSSPDANNRVNNSRNSRYVAPKANPNRTRTNAPTRSNNNDRSVQPNRRNSVTPPSRRTPDRTRTTRPSSPQRSTPSRSYSSPQRSTPSRMSSPTPSRSSAPRSSSGSSSRSGGRR